MLVQMCFFLCHYKILFYPPWNRKCFEVLHIYFAIEIIRTLISTNLSNYEGITESTERSKIKVPS